MYSKLNLKYIKIMHAPYINYKSHLLKLKRSGGGRSIADVKKTFKVLIAEKTAAFNCFN